MPVPPLSKHRASAGHRRRLAFEDVTSTNTLAREAAHAGDPEAPAPTTPPAPEPEPDPQPEPVNLTWDAPYERPEEYPGTVDLPQQLITLRDGIRLSATVTLPVRVPSFSCQASIS